MKVSDYVGKYAIHEHYGRVFIESAPPRSKAMVDIIVKQRGKGWNEATEKYDRYFLGASLNKDNSRSLRWKYTNTDQYGVKDTVHIKTLKLQDADK